MSNRKYQSYILAAEDEDSAVFYNYRDAFNEFSRSCGSSTLFGETEMGECEVIMSK